MSCFILQEQLETRMKLLQDTNEKQKIQVKYMFSFLAHLSNGMQIPILLMPDMLAYRAWQITIWRH